MPGAGVLNIRDWRDQLLAGKRTGGQTPLQVAEALQRDARETLRVVSELRPRQGTNKELRLTLGDFEAMALLGNYYAEKILGATELALFDKTGRSEQRASSVRHLESALAYWKQYAEAATRQYRPQLLTRVGYLDLNALTLKVRQDVDIASQWRAQTK